MTQTPPTQRQLNWIQILSKQAGVLLIELDTEVLKEKKSPETTEQAKDIINALDRLCAFLQETILERDNDLPDIHSENTTRKDVETLSTFYDVPPYVSELALSKLKSKQLV
ncbi:hypothetical protein H1S01_15050 [Heliobacterium chlorum]|uniref:Uncharacterized protein n=1 Tax=Heliobacterium chlorum TaxID=2698 RepID=A0ABR7T7Y0_HELCL|nr:hypothetical protein [Heliobacterium chlorum]MBC9785801.1 hypothetical protein [Heliobacterium chlorum]